MTNVEQPASGSEGARGDWFAEAERIAEAEGRDLSVLASHMDPDPEKFMQWSHEPCARSHKPGRICILPNGHPRAQRLGTEEREALLTVLRDVEDVGMRTGTWEQGRVLDAVETILTAHLADQAP